MPAVAYMEAIASLQAGNNRDSGNQARLFSCLLCHGSYDLIDQIQLREHCIQINSDHIPNLFDQFIVLISRHCVLVA